MTQRPAIAQIAGLATQGPGNKGYFTPREKSLVANALCMAAGIVLGLLILPAFWPERCATVAQWLAH